MLDFEIHHSIRNKSLDDAISEMKEFDWTSWADNQLTRLFFNFIFHLKNQHQDKIMSGQSLVDNDVSYNLGRCDALNELLDEFIRLKGDKS